MLLHEHYTRGRHAGISSITSVQRYRVLSPIIGVNATAMIAFRLGNVKEYEAISEENSAVISRDKFKELYHYPTSEPYSFLFINAMAKTVDETFWLRFEHPIALEQ